MELENNCHTEPVEVSQRQMPNGYKQTEVGLIPIDWDIVSLSEAVEFLDGKRRPIKSSERINGEFPYYGASGIIDYVSDYIFDDELLLLGEDGENILSRNLPLAFIVKGKVWINNHAHVMKPTSKFDIKFLAEYLESLDYTLLNSGTAQPKLNKQSCSNIRIAKPTLAEQKAIATALSDVDELISSLDALIAKKKAIKQGAMQQLLTPKKDWAEVSLIELAECKKSNFDDGDWVESEYIVNEGVRLIQTGNIGIGHFKEKGTKKYISYNSFDKLNCKEVLKGDLLVCRLAEPAGRACIMPDIGEERVITSVDVSIFRGDPELVNRDLLSQYFTTNEWFQKVIEKVGGTTHKRISRGALGQIKFKIPDMKEQKAIAQILSDMDKELEDLATKKEKYEHIKQGMMQELLTGKTRLV